MARRAGPVCRRAPARAVGRSRGAPPARPPGPERTPRPGPAGDPDRAVAPRRESGAGRPRGPALRGAGPDCRRGSLPGFRTAPEASPRKGRARVRAGPQAPRQRARSAPARTVGLARRRHAASRGSAPCSAPPRPPPEGCAAAPAFPRRAPRPARSDRPPPARQPGSVPALRAPALPPQTRRRESGGRQASPPRCRRVGGRRRWPRSPRRRGGPRQRESPRCDSRTWAGPGPPSASRPMITTISVRDRMFAPARERYLDCNLRGGEMSEAILALADRVTASSPREAAPSHTLSLQFPGGTLPLQSAISVGADGSNQVVLEDRFVSRFHCRLSPLAGLVARDPALAPVLDLLRRAAPSTLPVTLLGESGTGKEVAARAVHELSERNGGPFVPVNCGAISRELAEAELFGHERGAFTGAITSAPGAFGAADRGTLFLDEID